MDSIPIGLPPLPGEALDSYLESYAQRLHASVADIFQLANVTISRTPNPTKGSKPWLHSLAPDQLAALSATTTVPAKVLADMTLARYDGTGLVTINPTTGALGRPRWWQGLRGSRFCPRCLADTGGRWSLSWRLAWSFACTQHHLLLLDACPACGRRHFRTQPPPSSAGFCDIAGLAHPPPPRGATPACHYRLEQAPCLPLDPDGPVLSAQRHLNATITVLVGAHEPDQMVPLQHTLDDRYAAARAALSALWTAIPPPAGVTAIRGDLLGGTHHFGPGSHHQHAVRVAFGATIAHLMLAHGPHAPDPDITAWLLRVGDDRAESAPTVLLGQWERASLTLHGALLKTLGPRLHPAHQLRYNIPTDTPHRPRTGGKQRTAVIPSLFWRGWALRLNPPGLFDPLPYRHALAMLLAIAGLADLDYHKARTLLRQPPATNAVCAHFTSRLRRIGFLDTVLAALCHLAKALDEHGSPIDYARRRRRPRLYHAELDTRAWRDAGKQIRHRSSPHQEHLARLYLIELLTGNHPYYLPPPLTLPTSDGEDYATFTFTLPEALAACLHRQAERILRRAHIDEPACWEPPFDWADPVDWPGPHPDDLPAQEIWNLHRAGLTRATIATRLHTTVEHVHLTACRHPIPTRKRLPSTTALESLDANLPAAHQLRDYVRQGLGPRRIARITGCGFGEITKLLTAEGLTRPGPRTVLATVDADWLRHEYEDKHRSLKDIAAELGIPASDLAAHARKLGLALRHGVASRPHILADHGDPEAFPVIIWTAFAAPGAETRIRRFLAVPGHANLNQAAKHLGARKATLANQINQLEHATRTPLLETTPTGIALTKAGEEFAHDAHAILDMLANSQTRQNHSA